MKKIKMTGLLYLKKLGLLLFLYMSFSSYLNGQYMVVGCESFTGGIVSIGDSELSIAATGNFINSAEVHYSGVQVITNDGGFSESSDLSCIANMADPCLTSSGTSGDNIFGNAEASTTIGGNNAVRMYNVDIDRNIQLNNEWQLVNNFTFTNGVVTTNRSDLSHYLHFLDGASVAGNNDLNHVDGYVAFSGEGEFSLPLGDGTKEMPATVNGSCGSIFSAAYFGEDPTSASLPAEGPFPASMFEASISTVSSTEFWDVNGTGTTSITLEFDAASGLAAMTADIDSIVIVGWNGSEWVNLGNVANTGSTAAGGSISSISIVPDNYGAFTFGLTNEMLGFQIEMKVMLQGALFDPGGGYVGDGLMREDLNVGGYIPLEEPYGVDASVTTAAILSTNVGTANGIVDWVLIEIRDPADSTTVIAKKPALLQRDGDIVSPDDGLTTDLSFEGIPGSEFFIAIRHRNHFGVMTAAAIDVSTMPLIDFITMTESEIYHTDAPIDYAGAERASLTSGGPINALWAGDINQDNKIKYQGVASDLTNAFSEVLLFAGNSGKSYNYDAALGYFDGDINMDGKVKYQGSLNEGTFILTNILMYYPLNINDLYIYDLLKGQLPD